MEKLELVIEKLNKEKIGKSFDGYNVFELYFKTNGEGIRAADRRVSGAWHSIYSDVIKRLIPKNHLLIFRVNLPKSTLVIDGLKYIGKYKKHIDFICDKERIKNVMDAYWSRDIKYGRDFAWFDKEGVEGLIMEANKLNKVKEGLKIRGYLKRVEWMERSSYIYFYNAEYGNILRIVTKNLDYKKLNKLVKIDEINKNLEDLNYRKKIAKVIESEK